MIEDHTVHTPQPGPFPAGRRCVGAYKDGSRCITRLHRNHPGHYCYAHESQAAAPRSVLDDDAIPEAA